MWCMRVSVTPFSEDFGVMPVVMPKVPVIHIIVARDYPITGHNQIITTNNALYIADMEVKFIPPFMMQLNGITLDVS